MAAGLARLPVRRGAGRAGGRSRRPRPTPRRAALVVAVPVAGLALLRVFVASPVLVTSGSMAPTLRAGDVVLVARGRPSADELDRNDLVTFTSPQDGALSVKRVVGLPGDSVAILDARLHVNGRLVEEPHVDFRQWDGTFSPRVVVPPGTVFLLGDDRLRSVDSRDYGPVQISALDGRVVVRLWPPVRGGEDPLPPRP